MKHLGRKLLLPVAAVALAGGSFAFLASNNVSTSYAGSGTGTIAGYNVSGIHYTTVLGTNVGGSGNNNTAYITAIQFSLDHSANPANVTAVVNEPGVGQNYTYNECTSTNMTQFVCTNSSANNITGNTAVDGLAPTNPNAANGNDSTQLTVLAAS